MHMACGPRTLAQGDVGLISLECLKANRAFQPWLLSYKRQIKDMQRWGGGGVEVNTELAVKILSLPPVTQGHLDQA